MCYVSISKNNIFKQLLFSKTTEAIVVKFYLKNYKFGLGQESKMAVKVGQVQGPMVQVIWSKDYTDPCFGAIGQSKCPHLKSCNGCYRKRNGYEMIPHPAYSPDLAPGDFFLFPDLKKDIRGCHFRSDEELISAVEEWDIGK